MPLQFTANSLALSGMLQFAAVSRSINSSPGLREATQAEAETGTVQSRYMSPLRATQFFAAREATQAEAEAGEILGRYMSPLRVAQYVNSVPPPTDPLELVNGLSVIVTNPQIGSDPNGRRAIDVNVTTDSSTSNPNFSNEEGIRLVLTATHGQATAPAKKTFLPLNIGATYYASGQKFCFGSTNISYSMGDTATYGNNYVQFAGGPISGDEGVGWGLVSSLTQQRSILAPTITSVPTPATLNTTITQNITASKDPQDVTVASVVGAAIGDWVVIDQQVAGSSPTIEAVRLTDVSPTTIRGVFVNNHTSGATVKPALLLQINNSFGFGQDRLLVNLSQPSYSTGTVSSITGGAFTGSGTNWTVGMVGGNTLNIGAISLAADDYTGTPFDSGANRLRSWYQILSINSTTNLSMWTFSVAGDQAYRGRGPGAGTYVIRPSAKLLRNNGGGLMVLENSTSTWTAGDTVELVTCPYPDLSAWSYHISAYTPGGTYRQFMSVVNNGARTIGVAFGCDALNPIATAPDADLVGWDTGVLLSSVNTGVAIFNCLEEALSLDGTTNLGGKITWRNLGYLSPDVTNFGYQWQTTSSGPAGLLTFAAPNSPSNADTLSPAVTWAGKIRLTTASPSVAPALELYNTSDLTTNYQKSHLKIASDTICINSASGGTLSSTPMPLRFLINDVEKIKVGTASNGQDVVTISSLAVNMPKGTFSVINAISGLEGMVAAVTDSTTDTWGATITGGGALHVMAYHNGTNWTVMGK